MADKPVFNTLNNTADLLQPFVDQVPEANRSDPTAPISRAEFFRFAVTTNGSLTLICKAISQSGVNKEARVQMDEALDLIKLSLDSALRSSGIAGLEDVIEALENKGSNNG